MYLFLINRNGKAQFEIIVIGNIVCGYVCHLKNNADQAISLSKKN